MRVRLPFPPTINHYYGRDPRNGHPYLTKRAKQYRRQVALVMAGESTFGKARLAVKVEAHPPRQIGDLDNLLKPLLDALEHAGVFDNDKQVADLRIVRKHPVAAGAVEVQIWEIGKCS